MTKQLMKVEIGQTINVLRDLSVRDLTKGAQLSEHAGKGNMTDAGEPVTDVTPDEPLIVKEASGSNYWLMERPSGFVIRVCRTHFDPADPHNQKKTGSAQRTEQTPEQRKESAERQREYAEKLLAKAQEQSEEADVEIAVRDQQEESPAIEPEQDDARQEAEELFSQE